MNLKENVKKKKQKTKQTKKGIGGRLAGTSKKEIK